VGHVHAGQFVEVLGGYLKRRRARAVENLAGVGLDISDQLLDRLCRNRWVNGQHQRITGDDLGDGNEILDRIERQALVQAGGEGH